MGTKHDEMTAREIAANRAQKTSVTVTPIFPLGKIVATPAALVTFDMATLDRMLQRHCTGDWGDVCEEDRALNDEALAEGSRLLSAYTVNGEKLWIITEADRSVTTFLLPDEY